MNLKYTIFGGLTCLFMTLNQSGYASENKLRLVPPKIDFSQCVVSTKDLNSEAKLLEQTPVEKANILDKELIALSNIFKNGNKEIAPNIEKTIEIVEYLIAKKDIPDLLRARALKVKAQLMFSGEGYVEDKIEAQNILRNVMKNSDPSAALNLAKMLEDEGNVTEAESLYKDLLKDKNLYAALALSSMYNRREIIVPNETIENHIILAQNMLLEKLALGECEYFGKVGQMYINLRGLENHEKYAAEWFLPASKLNDPHSKRQLAGLVNKGYLSDIEGVPSAQQLLKEAADLGSAEAMYDLGLSLLTQTDTKQDAIAWFKKAGERNHMKAIEKLIKHYKNQSRDDYLYWLEKATAQDDIAPELLVDYADALRMDKNSDAAKIFALYERAGRMGNDEALFEMGQAHKFGIGVEKNPTTALRFYRLAAQNGNLDAYESIVEAYSCGFGKKQNQDIAKKWIMRGEYYGLDTIYDAMISDMNDVVENEKKQQVINSYIPQVIKIARDKKSVRAMVRLGVMYEFLNDEKNSTKWFESAFSMKNADEAYYHYAQELKNGYILDVDLDKSNEYMIKAADKNNSSALKRLGQAAEKQKQFESARDYFQKSYDFGDESSLVKLAMMELKLGNRDKAMAHLNNAANNYDIDAMFELSNLYADTNPDLAKQYFDRATQSYVCDTGDILDIAKAYMGGENGAPVDIERAQKWLSRIGDMNTLSKNDQMNYIKMIVNTDAFDGTSQLKQAVDRLETLAARGHDAKAISLLSDYYLNRVKDTQKAIHWLTINANNGHAQSMVDLGRLYLSGYMVEQSTPTAQKWLEKAAAQNNAEAIQLLKTIN